MHPIVLEALGGAAARLAELLVERVVRYASEARPPVPPADPIDEATWVMDGFLQAVAARDVNALLSLCHDPWEVQAETVQLLNDTLAAAPPASWAYVEQYGPEGWVAGAPLPWLLAELRVTFAGDGCYEVVPAVLRAVSTRAGWRIDYLDWGESDTPQPEHEGDFFMDLNTTTAFGELFATLPEFTAVDLEPPTAVIECARCGQRLSVPTDKGRLRVTCRKCANVQWFVP